MCTEYWESLIEREREGGRKWIYRLTVETSDTSILGKMEDVYDVCMFAYL